MSSTVTFVREFLFCDQACGVASSALGREGALASPRTQVDLPSENDPSMCREGPS